MKEHVKCSEKCNVTVKNGFENGFAKTKLMKTFRRNNFEKLK